MSCVSHAGCVQQPCCQHDQRQRKHPQTAKAWAPRTSSSCFDTVASGRFPREARLAEAHPADHRAERDDVAGGTQYGHDGRDRLSDQRAGSRRYRFRLWILARHASAAL